MKIKYFVFLLIVTLPAILSPASAKSNGTTAGNFLSIDIGARPVAMGGAYTAIGADAESLAYNPAGIALATCPNLSLMHNQWFEGIALDYLGLAVPTRIGSFGVSGRMLWMDQMEITTLAQPSGSGEEFTSVDTAYGLAYACTFFKKFALGVNYKMVNETINNESAGTSAIDAGFIFAPTSRFLLGISALNLTGALKYFDESFNLPREKRLSIAYKLLKNRNLAFATDLKIDSEGKIDQLFGAEYLLGILALRAGYRGDIKDNVDSASGISAGLGLKLGSFELNYAWVPYGDLGTANRLSIGICFGNSETPASSNDKSVELKKPVIANDKNIIRKGKVVPR
ncbi:MAG: PorV/PorQ family protein [Elusimicrobiota bacterium]